MGLLALGSWWLVKNTPLPEAPRAAPRRATSPTTRCTSSRSSASRPKGRCGRRSRARCCATIPDTDTFEIERPRVRAYAPGGGVTSASARRALSNADATEVQLLGDAQVTREATASEEGISFRGEFLHAFLKTEQVRSHLPATVTRGGTVIRADAFSYDNLDRTVSMTGRVRASFPAPARRQAPAGGEAHRREAT